MLALSLILASSLIGGKEGRNTIGLSTLLSATHEDLEILHPEDVISGCTTHLKNLGSLNREQKISLLEKRASALKKLDRDKEALADFDEILSLSPTDFRGRRGRAAVYLKLGKLDDALEEIGRLKETVGDSDDVLFLTGCFHAARNELEKASASFVEAEKKSTRRTSIHYNMAVLCVRNGNHSEAIRLIDGLIVSRPDAVVKDHNMLVLKGYCLYQLDKKAEALASLRAAIQMKTSSTLAYTLLDDIYKEQFKLDIALLLCEQGISISPENSDLWNRAVKNAAASKDRTSLVRLRKRLEEIVNRSADLEINASQLDINLGKHERALASLERVLKKEPNNGEALYLKGLILVCSGQEHVRDGKAGIAIAAKLCADASRKELTALTLLARAKAEMGEFGEGIDLVNEALRLPDLTGAHILDCHNLLTLFKAKTPYRLRVVAE